MKTKCCLYIFFGVLLITGIASIGFAESTNCIVVEKQGSLLTVSCPGEGPKVINMGGSADIYKSGDPVTVPGKTNKGREVRPRIR